MGALPQVLGRTSAGKWVKSASVSASGLKCTAELSEILKRQIAGKVHHDLNDFDDHLDDLERYATLRCSRVGTVEQPLKLTISGRVQGLAKSRIAVALMLCQLPALCMLHKLW